MAAAVFAVISLHARELRVTTWNLNQGMDASDPPVATETEDALVERVAKELSATRSDVIILRDVRDRQVSHRIADRLTGGNFGVVACTDFEGGATGNPTQVAILSRAPAFSAWTERWKLEGEPDLAGGFAFAGIRLDDVDACIYALQLPQLTPRDPLDGVPVARTADYDALVQQVIQHAAAAGNRNTNRTTAFLVSGDPGAVAMEEPAIRQGVFQALQESGLQEIRHRRSEPVDSEPEADRHGFLFARNATLIEPAAFAGEGPMTHGLSILPAATLTTVRETPGDAFAGPTRLLLWLGIALGVTVIVVALIQGLRSTARLRVARPASPSEGNLSTAVTRTTYVNRLATEAAPPGGITEAPTETASSDVPVWQQRPLRTAAPADESEASARDRLMPHLARMMKDKLLWRLLAQRSQTIQIHEASARVVAELEQRLALIQTQFESRVQAYENRIAELERELAAKETITRELLESRVQAARLAIEQEEPPESRPSVVYTLRFGDLMARKSTGRTASRSDPERN